MKEPTRAGRGRPVSYSQAQKDEVIKLAKSQEGTYTAASIQSQLKGEPLDVRTVDRILRAEGL